MADITTKVAGAAFDLAGTDTGEAAQLDILDAAASMVAAQVEAALAELSTPVTLSAAAEGGDAIVVTLAGPAHAAQYFAQVYDAAGLEALVGVWTITIGGGASAVSTNVKPGVVFTSSAGGAATLTVTDVATGTGATVYLEVRPASVQAGSKAGPAALIPLTFAV